MKFSKQFRSIYDRWMLICVALAALLRLVLIYFNWPTPNGDEANMALLALHVAFKGEHPVHFYGSDYMGSLEGYAAAPFFRLFGASLFTLRLPLVIFFVIFLISMYYLLKLLYQSPKFALAMVILLGLGSPDVLLLQLRATGEYPEFGMLATLLCLIAVGLALTAPLAEQKLTWQESWKRLLAYGLFGLVAGIAIWTDLLIGPFVLATGLLLVLFCRREVMKLPGLSLLLGLVLGAFPLIYYNLTVPLSQNSLFVTFALSSGTGQNQMLANHLTWFNQLTGLLVVALPMASGGSWSCSFTDLAPYSSPMPTALSCTLVQTAWSLGYLILCISAGGLAVYALYRGYRRRHVDQLSSPSLALEERQEAIRQYGRLAVLGSVGLILLFYIHSAAPATYPATSFRYLTCVLLAFPVLLWPLWQGLGTRKISFKWWLQAALLLAVAATFASGMIRTFIQIPANQPYYMRQEGLIQDLLDMHVTRFYSDYWTCNVLIFLSKEKLICSTVDSNVRAIPNRYLPYTLTVQATPHPAYVFQADSPQARIMQQRTRAPSSTYRAYEFEGYIVFVYSRPGAPG